MIAAINSNVSGFVGTGSAAKMLGVSRSQVVLLERAGEIESFTTVGGHRRISVSSIRRFNGEDNTIVDADGTIPIAIVSRTSTNGRAKGYGKQDENGRDIENDLTRQEQTNLNYVKEQWGDKAEVSMYSRIASGMNYDDATFVRLINDILSGKFSGGYLVVTHPDRLIRFGRSMVEKVCEFGNCTIVYSDESEQEEKSLESEIVQDCIAVMTHYSAKVHGARSAKTNGRTIDDPAAIETLVTLRNNGVSIIGTMRELNKQGYTNNKGGKISEHIVKKMFAQLDADIEYSHKAEQSDEIKQWWKKSIKVLTRYDRKDKKVRIENGKLWEVFIKDNPNTVYNRNQFIRTVKTLVGEDRILLSNAKRYIAGVVYKGNLCR